MEKRLQPDFSEDSRRREVPAIYRDGSSEWLPLMTALTLAIKGIAHIDGELSVLVDDDTA